MTEGNTVLNALVGGAVAIIISFIPFSPLIGGGVAGYLQKGSPRAGAAVGFGAGLIALIPGVFVLGFLALVMAVPAGPALFRLRLTLGVFLLLLVLYTVGLGVLGGVAGAYLAIERDPETAGLRP